MELLSNLPKQGFFTDEAATLQVLLSQHRMEMVTIGCRCNWIVVPVPESARQSTLSNRLYWSTPCCLPLQTPVPVYMCYHDTAPPGRRSLPSSCCSCFYDWSAVQVMNPHLCPQTTKWFAQTRPTYWFAASASRRHGRMRRSRNGYFVPANRLPENSAWANTRSLLCRQADSSAEERPSKRAAGGRPSLEGMTVEKLKAFLRENGLPTKGKKVAASTGMGHRMVGCMSSSGTDYLGLWEGHRTSCWNGLNVSLKSDRLSSAYRKVWAFCSPWPLVCIAVEKQRRTFSESVTIVILFVLIG